MLNAADQEQLDSIRRATRDRLTEVLGGARRVALLDFPLHQNAGDSLIWMGELSSLAELGVDIAYRSDRTRYDPAELARRLPSGPVLLHGGGNVGDLWPPFEEFRRRVVADWPDRSIVILSQSVLYRDPTNAARSNAVFGVHPDLTLLVRDAASLDRARIALPDVRTLFCHDMAFGYAPPARVHRPSVRVVHLSRTDHEKGELIDEEGWSTIDWGLRGPAAAMWAACRAPGIVRTRLPSLAPKPLAGLNQRLYDAQARRNVDDATRKLGRGRVVVTDRLHAHVLCALLGIPHVVVDNSYGKIGAVFDEYSGRFSTARFATSPAEAVKLCGELLEEIEDVRS
jgi:exopolysaccharide biosynthesis predicted pyruvyltransferase EpsI